MLFYSLLIGPLTAIAIIYTFRNGAGDPKICHPYCSRCSYDLRVNWKTAKHCPECGNDLSWDESVYFGKFPQNDHDKPMNTASTILIVVVVCVVLWLILFM